MSTLADRTLLVVDMQQGFIGDAVASGRVPADLPARISAAATSYASVVIAVSSNPTDGPWQQLLGWNGLQGPEDLRLVPELAPLAARGSTGFVRKTGYSAAAVYLHAGPNDARRHDTWRHVDVCGVDTDACVLATVFGLFDAGLDVRVRVDLCASTGGVTAHENAAALMRRQFGTRRTLASAPQIAAA